MQQEISENQTVCGEEGEQNQASHSAACIYRTDQPSEGATTIADLRVTDGWQTYTWITSSYSDVGEYKDVSLRKLHIYGLKWARDWGWAVWLPQAQHSAFTGCKLDEAEGGGVIMLIIICGCDVLKCKAHLNPAANYGMFCGDVRAAVVGLRVIRCLKHKNRHQSDVKSVIIRPCTK